jgi:hypothetical protein
MAPPLIERRLRSLLSLIDAWLLDREVAKDPKLRTGSIEVTSESSQGEARESTFESDRMRASRGDAQK